VDTTKTPVDVDSVTNTLWTYDCPGTKVTNGYLDFTQVDANNSVWQGFDQIWVQRARKGAGVRGGPNNAATSYFYKSGFWTPFGKTWGAPFAPTATCTQNTGSPPPDYTLPPAPTDTPTPTATPPAAPTPTAAPTPSPSPSPTPAALPLLPLPLWGFRAARSWRRNRG
jgi:hypothetical protein